MDPILENKMAVYIAKSKRINTEFYERLRKLKPDWFQSVSVVKKQKLIEMAKNGEDKPNLNDNSLGIALYCYTNSKRKTYDSSFDKMIRELRPEWFETQSTKAERTKAELIDMASKGLPKPYYEDELGKKYYNYICQSSSSYDPQFVKVIRNIRPDWFENQSSRALSKKNQIIEMAKKGERRPSSKNHPLGFALMAYIRKSNHSYDSQFDKVIREIRPDWFEDKVAEKKKKLIQMAKDGLTRPSINNSELGKAIVYYTLKSKPSYDPEFDSEIRRLRPDWFYNRKK